MREKLIVESRFADGGGFTNRENVEFAQGVCRAAIKRGFNPYASHLFFPGILDDNKTEERNLGIRLGLEWAACGIEEVWVALRPGEEMSEGVAFGLRWHTNQGHRIAVIRCHPDGQIIEIEERINV